MKNTLFLIVKPKNDQIKNGEILEGIRKDADINFSNFNISYANSIYQFLFEYKDQVADFFVEHGMGDFFSSVELNESFIAKGESEPRIITIFDKYLKNMEIDRELIIIDPYFLAPTRKPGYPEFVESILSPYLKRIDTIIIITNNFKVDSSILTQIEVKLKSHNPQLQITHKTSNDYHDRYWISNNREKGIMLGSSLNGLGNKSVLIDRINTSDVREIIHSLNTEGLL